MEPEKKEEHLSTTVIIPTFNEADNIPELISRLRGVMPDVDILVVDDDSPDGTATVAERLGCSVVVRKDKKGLSSAVIDGFGTVDSDNIVVMDADLQHSPELVPHLVGALKENDIVVASRHCEGGTIEGWSLTRRFVSWVANLLSLPLVPRVKDRTSGYFALRRSVLPPLNMLNGTGFKIMLEVLVKSGSKRVGEVPCSFVPRARGASKFDAKQVREYLKHLGYLYIYKYKRFIKFCIVGAWGTSVNMGLYALLMYKADLHYLIAAVIGTEIAVITQFILNDRWTFKDRRNLGGSTLVRAQKYFLTCAGGIVICFIVLSLLVEILEVNKLVSYFIGILAGFLWNFAGSTLWAWRVKKPSGSDQS